ncbi:MAG: SH3-like domain-containing protein [Rickettsiales bacterium]|jgi:SH3-like domain-containing protein
MKKFLLLISFLPFLLPVSSKAFDKPVKTNYFVSLRASETNVRAGPGSKYSIKFTFKLRGIPVKVVSEYDNWNEVEDYEGGTGWIIQSLVTKKRTIIVKTAKSFINLYSKPSTKSKVLLRLENNVVADLFKCNINYCIIKIDGKKGWITKKEIWGIDENDMPN